VLCVCLLLTVPHKAGFMIPAHSEEEVLKMIGCIRCSLDFMMPAQSEVGVPRMIGCIRCSLDCAMQTIL
jgi:hypothetical protein